MLIMIPSRSRAGKVDTLKSLPKSWDPSKIFLVVPHEQATEYGRAYPKTQILSQSGISGIGPARDLCIDYASGRGENVLMLDDDLTFAVRRNDYPTKFWPVTDFDVACALKETEMHLGTYPMIGMSSREGGNRVTEKYTWNTRSLRWLAYAPDYLRKHKIRFSDIEFMEDFHVELSLLCAGYDIPNINWMVHNQRGSNTSGGCSDYRTLDRQALAAHALKARWPDYVTVVEKETKTAWGGQRRTDVRIKWKEAREFGRARRSSVVLDANKGADSTG